MYPATAWDELAAFVDRLGLTATVTPTTRTGEYDGVIHWPDGRSIRVSALTVMDAYDDIGPMPVPPQMHDLLSVLAPAEGDDNGYEAEARAAFGADYDEFVRLIDALSW